jgi:alanine racemase
MKTFSENDILSISDIKRFGNHSDRAIKHLLIDSRKLIAPEQTLFFAIKTVSNDGHHYIDELYQRGVRSFVVAELPDFSIYPQASFFHTKDVVDVLQKISSFHRKQFSYPVIAITGSNGKTIVKEWLYHLLQPFMEMVRSPRSYNSQLGVPLSIWQMDDSHELGIFEAGISLPSEMTRLQEVIQPTIGLITNIGAAHAEGFSGIDQKLQEKMELFSDVETMIYCKDQVEIDQFINSHSNFTVNKRLISWGKSDAADIVIKNIEEKDSCSFFTVLIRQQVYSFSIPFTDKIAQENIMHCFAASFALGMQEKVLPRMMDLPSLSMRLEMKEGQHQSILINDSYNADLTGVKSAIEFLATQKSGVEKTVILSDITGLSQHLEDTYKELALFLQSKKISTLYSVGDQFAQYAPYFIHAGIRTLNFKTTDELLADLHPSFFKDQVVLIKGARHYHFERVSQLLETKIHKTRLEVNLSAIAQNLKNYRAKLNPSIKVMAMVKAFSYGAGSFEIADLLQRNRIDYIAVAYVDEGVELRKAGIHLPIMIMNAEVDGFPALVEYDLEPEIFSIEQSIKFNAFLENEGINHFPIHLKIDTGMHRLGLDAEQVKQFLYLFSGNRYLIKSVFTHLVASEDPAQDAFTRQQLQLFEHISQEVQSAFDYPIIRHASNTAAIHRHPNAAYEMVRLGIGLYGVSSAKESISLTEAVELKTTIAQIRKVKKGESVGYGRATILKNDTLVATIRIGYADGFPRSLGNGRGEVLIRGNMYPTIGNVCMDMTMIDLGAHHQIQADDEVLIFGKDFSVKEFAQRAMTIPYEIMTGISSRVPRIYLSE